MRTQLKREPVQTFYFSYSRQCFHRNIHFHCYSSFSSSKTRQCLGVMARRKVAKARKMAMEKNMKRKVLAEREERRALVARKAVRSSQQQPQISPRPHLVSDSSCPGFID